MDVNMVEALPIMNPSDDFLADESEDLARIENCFKPNFVYYTQKILCRL